MRTSGGGMRPSVSLSLPPPSSPKPCNTTRLPAIRSHQRADKRAPLQHSVAFNSIPSSEVRTAFFVSQRTRAPASPKFDEEDGRTPGMLKPCFSGGCLLACLLASSACSLARPPAAADAAKFFILNPSLRPSPVPPSVPINARHLSRPISPAESRIALLHWLVAGCASEARAGADATSDGMPSFPKKSWGGFWFQGSDTTFKPARVPLGWFGAEGEAPTPRESKRKKKKERKGNGRERDNQRVPKGQTLDPWLEIA
ncbi:hypothetical protein LX32DRAFT_288552 [Colletotrichum zoysiae]|uniref:Uncharacterized protein n=1 Tax=Colletotrichum zoysiae TaxID=1216348 RepID=A0AAD9HNU8_9PEZI|nr:hypothetical protein LX32DRAFT_288552 [Colletotrichum zoysiae]